METKKLRKLYFRLSFLVLFATIGSLFGCDDSSDNSTPVTGEKEETPSENNNSGSATKAKYVFLFIGDGMSNAQISAADLFQASIAEQQDEDYINSPNSLTMTTFPATGFATTHDAGTYITDSASAATAMACGYKTLSGVLSMDVSRTTSYKTIAEAAKENGMKVGIITSVSLDHATPASFYAHQPSRNSFYEIGMELASSGFDYFGGGGFCESKYSGENKNQPVCRDAAIAAGYSFVNSRSQFDALSQESGKVLAINSILDSSSALPYELVRDKSEGSSDISLAEYTEKGIELLENESGFFMMVEGGKIDWACHANDAYSSIQDTIAFDNAVAEAVEFYNRYPEETLIVVTGDHECGGLSIGYSGTRYSTYFSRMRNQTMSFDVFDGTYGDLSEVSSLSELYSAIDSAFGFNLSGGGDSDMDLSEYDMEQLQEAFDAQKSGKDSNMTGDEFYDLYGGYRPLSVTLTHILNRKSGLAWTSYSHTGVPVPVFAKGAGAEDFNGYYDNTDICKKMSAAMGLSFIQ